MDSLRLRELEAQFHRKKYLEESVKKDPRSKHFIHRTLQLVFLTGFLLLCTAFSEWSYGPDPQENRKTKVSVPPEYPELARRLNIKGVARVQITISTGGDVTAAKEGGGNPGLREALNSGTRKAKNEPSTESTVGVKFE